MPRVSSKVHPTQTSESADAPVPAPLERTSSRKKMIEEDSGPEGVLVFRLIRARNLIAADSNGYSDPYVVARLRGSRLQAWRSPTRWKTLNPDWDAVHEFPGYLSDLASYPLELKLYDYDTFSCARCCRCAFEHTCYPLRDAAIYVWNCTNKLRRLDSRKCS